MNPQGMTSDQASSQKEEPAGADSPQIAIQDRLVVLMFLIVGGLFGAILLADLLLGFFR